MSGEVDQWLQRVLFARSVLEQGIGAGIVSDVPTDVGGVRCWWRTSCQDVADAVCDADTLDQAVELLVNAWGITPSDADLSLGMPLVRAGAALAEKWGAEPPLMRPFRLAAEYFRDRGDCRLAVDQGRRELAVARALGDCHSRVSALAGLALSYRLQCRLHRAIGCVDEMVVCYQLSSDHAGMARAFGHLGHLLAEAGTYVDAFDYFTRAEQLCAERSDASGRFKWRVVRGCLRWKFGDERAGRNLLVRAVSLAPNEDSAVRLRSLLSIPKSVQFPDFEWPVFDEPLFVMPIQRIDKM